jgi:hypothetical protein
VPVTYNKKDFSRTANQWPRDGREHAGLIIASSKCVTPELVAAKIARLLTVWTSESIRNVVLHINADPEERVVGPGETQ